MDRPKSRLVTAESVKAAAQALASTGRKISVRAVIGELGGGSPNAVLAHLKSWRAEHPVAADAVPVMVDPRILQILREQIGGAEERALEAARERVAEVEEDNAALGEEVTKLQAALEAVEQKCQEAIAAAVAQAEKARAEAEAAIDKASAEARREREIAVATHDALAVATARLEELPALKAELDRLRHQLATERAARATAEQGAAVAGEQAAGAARLVAQSSEQATQLRADLTRVQGELGTLRQALTEERGARAAAEQAAAVLTAQKAHLEERLAAAQAEGPAHRRDQGGQSRS